MPEGTRHIRDHRLPPPTNHCVDSPPVTRQGTVPGQGHLGPLNVCLTYANVHVYAPVYAHVYTQLPAGVKVHLPHNEPTCLAHMSGRMTGPHVCPHDWPTCLPACLAHMSAHIFMHTSLTHHSPSATFDHMPWVATCPTGSSHAANVGSVGHIRLGTGARRGVRGGPGPSLVRPLLPVAIAKCYRRRDLMCADTSMDMCMAMCMNVCMDIDMLLTKCSRRKNCMRIDMCIWTCV